MGEDAWILSSSPPPHHVSDIGTGGLDLEWCQISSADLTFLQNPYIKVGEIVDGQRNALVRSVCGVASSSAAAVKFQRPPPTDHADQKSSCEDSGRTSDSAPNAFEFWQPQVMREGEVVAANVPNSLCKYIIHED